MKKIILSFVIVTFVFTGAWLGYMKPELLAPASVQSQTTSLDKVNAAPVDTSVINDKMPYSPKEVTIQGRKLYYVRAGQGEHTFLFLHGSPTQSYIWRNIMPHVAQKAAVTAFDWPGFGRSEKKNTHTMTYDDFYQTLDGFVKKLNLENVILVVHDWAGMVGFRYAQKNPDNIKGVVFMETLAPPLMPLKSYEDIGPRVGHFFRNARGDNPDFSPEELFIEKNLFMDLFLRNSALRDYTEKEKQTYSEPFDDPENRKMLLVWPNLLPVGGEPASMADITQSYGKWFIKSDTPKLFLYAEPGMFLKPDVADWYKENVPSVTSVKVGKGHHYIQEDNAHAIGRAISKWYSDTFQ